MVVDQLKELKIPNTRGLRFQGKVSEATALCRGGDQALQFRATPWVDWTNYWGTGDMSSLPTGFISSKLPAQRGVTGALLDLELQRVELIKFNLFDNSGTFEDFVKGRNGVSGSALKVWPEMRLKTTNPSYKDVGGDGPQVCKGDLIRWRTVTGICNDILNPAMGSSGMLFARNVEFETSFPDLGLNELTRNRHGNRLSLLEPDPQVISRRLFTRVQSQPRQMHGRIRPAGLLQGRQLRLREGAILQCAGGILDPVHDPRLVLAPRRRTQCDLNI